MEGMIVEEKTQNKDIRDILFQESNTPQIDFHQLLNAIDGAKDDDKIKGIFLDLSDFLGGYPAELIKIANQLEDFKLSGKFIISYSDLDPISYLQLALRSQLQRQLSSQLQS